MEEFLIERLGHKGDGLTADGITVALTLPGERIAGEVVAGRIDAPRILAPSQDRVSAPCKHFKTCGGCTLQHGSDAFLARWKQEVVEKALAAHGLTTVFRTIQTSPSRSRRRATLAGRRTKKGAMIGFHARRSDTIIAIQDCHLLHPDLMGTLPALEEMTRIGASRSATVSFALTRSTAGLDCAVVGAKPLDANLRQILPRFAQHFIRLTWNEDPVFTDAPAVQRFGDTDVIPPPGAFLQATSEGEAALRAAILETLNSARHVLDLFSGCGTFTFPLAKHAAVHAVEGSPDMIAALDHATRFSQGLKAVTTETRDLFRRPLLPDEITRYDAALIDPPRAGAAAQIAELAKSDLQRIAYVSCNPISFARDAKTLSDAGFDLKWVQVVDQFRWSPHIELAAMLTRPE